MRIAVFLLLCLLVSGCIGKGKPSPLGGFHRLNTSALYFTAEENTRWRILQPPQGQWRMAFSVVPDGTQSWQDEIRIGRSSAGYLPKYFPTHIKDLSRVHENASNFFYAVYSFDGVGEGVDELALWINFDDALQIQREIRLDFWENRLSGTIHDTTIINKFSLCGRKNFQHIKIFFNTVDVLFDSGSVYIVKDGKILKGAEIPDDLSFYDFEETEIWEPAVYDLSSPETVKKKQPFGRPWLDRRTNELREHPILGPPLPVFKYRFAMTCRDLEGAVLVIDGLYRHGKKLPPLKVQMRYYDFDLVPEYVGPPLARSLQRPKKYLPGMWNL